MYSLAAAVAAFWPEPALPNVIRSDRPNLAYFNPSAPMLDAQPAAEFRAPYNWSDVSTAEVVEALGVSSASSYTYASIPVSQLPEQEHLYQLLDVLQEPDTVEAAHGGLWLSSPNSTSLMHFDSSPNILMQLHGEKQVLLASSSLWRQLRLFPATHPAARQSQLRISILSDALEAALRANSTGNGLHKHTFQLGEDVLKVTSHPDT